MATILVTGITGKTGRALAGELLARGAAVRGGAREPQRLGLPGVAAVPFDWADEATWGPALAGAEAAYLVKPKLPDVAERVARLLAGGAGLRRVVLLSEIGAERRDPATPERATELAVQDGAAAPTILRPNWFMQNLADPAFWLGAVRDEGRLPLASGGRAIGFVDVRDIAAVAAQALLAEGHEGAAYTVTGGEALTVAAVAARLSAATGRPVQAHDPPLAEVVRARLAAGMPASMAGYVERIHREIQEGGAAQVTGVVERVTGRAPRTLDAFIAEHAGLWRPGATASAAPPLAAAR